MDSPIVEVLLCEHLSLHMRRYISDYALATFGNRVKPIDGPVLSVWFQHPEHAAMFVSVFQVFVKSTMMRDVQE